MNVNETRNTLSGVAGQEGLPLESMKPSAEQDLQGKLEQLDVDIRALAVVDGESYQLAGALGVAVRNITKEIKSYFKPAKDFAYARHKELCVKENSYLDPLKEWEYTLKSKMNRYQEEVNRHKEEMALKIAEEKKAEEQIYLDKIQEMEAVKKFNTTIKTVTSKCYVSFYEKVYLHMRINSGLGAKFPLPPSSY